MRDLVGPVARIEDRLVLPHLHRVRLHAYIGEQLPGIGEDVVAEGDGRTLRSGVDLRDARHLAQPLDRDDAQQMLHLIGQRTETVDHLRREGVDVLIDLDFAEAAIERKPHIEIGDIGLGISTAMPRLICGDQSCVSSASPPDLRLATASSSMS